MNNKYTKDLISLYPELFGGYEFTFECGDGWYELLKECIKEIKSICEDQKIEIQATQIKEKYGSLRFYTDYCYEYIEPIIRRAEDQSCITCELCGNEGKIHKLHWIQCLCDECLQKIS